MNEKLSPKELRRPWFRLVLTQWHGQQPSIKKAVARLLEIVVKAEKAKGG